MMATMTVGTQATAKRIRRGVGGRAFPHDYNWICRVCGYENRAFAETCQACEHRARVEEPWPAAQR